MGQSLRAMALIDNLALCKLLSVKPNTWRKRVREGHAPLPFVYQGKRCYYRRADIVHYLKVGLWPAHMKFKGRPAPDQSPPSPT